jgi:hypothetical protein
MTDGSRRLSFLIAPPFSFAAAFIYYDQRIRLEGYDIERMMQAAGMNASATSVAGEGDAVPATAGEARG